MRLVAVALLATIVVGAFIFFRARTLLNNGVERQLVTQQQSQARAIAEGLDFVGDSVSVIARDEATVQALSDLAAAFDALSDQSDLLGPEQVAMLEDYYDNVVGPGLVAASLTPPADADLLPRSAAARYLQYHYLVTNPFEPGERDQLVAAEDDGSEYGQAHAEHHPSLDRQREALGFADLLLLDADGTIVYTAEKRTDLGRTLDIDTLLGQGITSLPRRLAVVAIGQPVLVDFERNPAADGAPTLLGAAALYGPDGTIGAVVVEIPISALNRITTADGRWREIGLGDTGETYVVGQDLTMRSDARLWLESPTAYLEALADHDYPEEVGQAIEQFDTTVLLQPVDTKPVEAAFDGDRFVGRARDYLGRSTLSVSGRIDNSQLDWVVVAEISLAEAGETLGAYISRLLITAAIMIPLVALAGLFLAGSFTRPFRPVVQAADQIASGDLDVTIPDLGSNEISDVARRLTDVAGFLQEQERTLVEEERETARLLRSILPARLVDRFRGSERDLAPTGDSRDVVDSVTAVAITIVNLDEPVSVDPDTSAELGAQLSHGLEDAAARLGMERVRSSADQHVFLSGLDQPTIEADRAARFALSVREVLEQFAEETGMHSSFHVGISSGTVFSGLLASDLLTYGVFGDPPQTALTLASIAPPGQILVERQTATELEATWRLETIEDLESMRGGTIDAMLLVGLRSAPTDANGVESSPNPIDRPG